MNAGELTLHYDESIDLGATADLVFGYLDDFEALGAHMTRASWMMAGSRMRYEFDEARGRRVGAHVRLRGSILGVPLDIEERVIERVPPFRKAWQTIGRPRMVVLAHYRMGFSIAPIAGGCRTTVFIDYARAEAGIARWLGRAGADYYARWCVRSMTGQAAGKLGRLYA
jgi:hypothetical protein